MYPVIQHLISSAFTTTIAIAMTSAQTGHKEEMLTLHKMIEKSLKNPAPPLPLPIQIRLAISLFI